MTTDDRHGTAGQTSVQLWAVCSQLIDLAKSDLKLGLKSTFVLIYYVQLPADACDSCALKSAISIACDWHSAPSPTLVTCLEYLAIQSS